MPRPKTVMSAAAARDRSVRGRKEAKLVLAEVHRILNDAKLTVAGHVLVWLHFEFSQTLQNADGATYHGIARYNAITHEA